MSQNMIASLCIQLFKLTFTSCSGFHAQKSKLVSFLLLSADMQIPLNTLTTIRSCRIGLKCI